MGKATVKSYVADFETTTDPQDCRVWLWGLCLVNDCQEWQWGTDIAGFLEVVKSLGSGYVYFHNLSFDGSFIVDYLLKAGYTHTEERKVNPGQFSTMISKMGQWYGVTVAFEGGPRIEFRDSLKKVPLPVSVIAETFGLEESKGDLDYDKHRPVGYQPGEDELDYLRRDIQIVAQALKLQLAAGMKKLTVGADSLAEFKRITGSKFFSRMYPILNKTIDDDVRLAYRGGFTYADPRFKNRRLGSGNVYDVNSLYPFVMYTCPLPYGEPVWFRGAPKPDDTYPLYVVGVTFTAKLKKDHIPCIQVKNSPHFAATQYQEKITDPVTMFVSSVDWELWNEQYDIDVICWEGGWKFKQAYGMFAEYIEKWSAVKATSKGGSRFIAKLHLNSLYGKFATNPDVSGKIPVLDGDTVRLVAGRPETRDPVYTPVGVFITAHARNLTIRAAQANYDTFAYADTDSLHLLTDEPVGLDVDPSRLGAWKHEGRFIAAFYARAKAYIELMEEGWYSVHIAGLPSVIADTLTLDDFIPGKTFSGKLSPKRVPGGIVLEDVGYTLNLDK